MEKSVAYVAVFAALIAALGLVPAITLPFGIPVTAQSLGIMLCGTLLGARRGSLAALLFIILVALGLPILAGGRGGLGVFQGPTIGFLLGWPIAALVVGWSFVQLRLRCSVPIAAFIASIFGGILVLYAAGILGLAIVAEKSIFEALVLVAVFIFGDLIKATIAAWITWVVFRARPDWGST